MVAIRLGLAPMPEWPTHWPDLDDTGSILQWEGLSPMGKALVKVDFIDHVFSLHFLYKYKLLGVRCSCKVPSNILDY